MNWMERLKSYDRTLLEMHIGSVFFGVVCQIAGLIFAEDKLRYSSSLWLGILLSVVSSIHLYRSISKVLDYEAEAASMMTRIYFIRYAAVIIVLLVITFTGVLYPLIVFLGYMSLKVTALIQPLTHKLCNKLFRENE